MTTQAWLWTGAGAALALAIIAGLADRARMRRRDLDAPGWVPWAPIAFLAMLGALILGLIAATGRADLPTGYHSVPRR